MDKLIELGELLDWYGLLLTEKQREIMAQYANENCSLSEIAGREGISRQGVRDTLKRAEVWTRWKAFGKNSLKNCVFQLCAVFAFAAEWRSNFASETGKTAGKGSRVNGI